MYNCQLLLNDRFKAYMLAVPSMLDKNPDPAKVLEDNNKRILEL